MAETYEEIAKLKTEIYNLLLELKGLILGLKTVSLNDEKGRPTNSKLSLGEGESRINAVITIMTQAIAQSPEAAKLVSENKKLSEDAKGDAKKIEQKLNEFRQSLQKDYNIANTIINVEEHVLEEETAELSTINQSLAINFDELKNIQQTHDLIESIVSNLNRFKTLIIKRGDLRNATRAMKNCMNKDYRIYNDLFKRFHKLMYEIKPKSEQDIPFKRLTEKPYTTINSEIQELNTIFINLVNDLNQLSGYELSVGEEVFKEIDDDAKINSEINNLENYCRNLESKYLKILKPYVDQRQGDFDLEKVDEATKSNTKKALSSDISKIQQTTEFLFNSTKKDLDVIQNIIGNEQNLISILRKIHPDIEKSIKLIVSIENILKA